MKLTNGSYYKTGEGKVVRVQLEQSGKLSAYDASGSKVHTCNEDDHVNGWEPCGQADFKAARNEATKKARKKAGREKKPTKKE